VFTVDFPPVQIYSQIQAKDTLNVFLKLVQMNNTGHFM